MRTTFLSLALLASFHCLAQNFHCGFDNIRMTDAASLQKEENINRLLYEYAVNNSSAKIAQLVLTIPVAVHIIHQNGPENIADSSVITALNELNLRFQNAAPFYDSTGHDIQIQFCLASVDPYGNATTGITRTASPYTDLNSYPGATDLSLKNLARWEPNLYMNIWIVRSLNLVSTVAYAYYPASAGNGNDGIVCMYSYFNSGTLAHEVGHYLGLYHTFEGGCNNFNCQLDGDHICDTPPDASNDFICPNNSCTTEMDDTSGFNPFFNDQQELPNYMDYTYCPLSFSADQSSRMNAVLTQIRSTLLQSNGCGQNPGGIIPVASFTMGSPSCYSYPFTNTSLNSVGAQWDFDNDGNIDDAGNNVTHTFSSTGYFNVTLYASGYGGIDTISQMIFVQSVPYQNYPMINGFSGVGVSLIQGQLVYCQGANVIFHGEPGMVSYLWTTGDTTQDLSFYPTGPFVAGLTAVDSAGLIWSSCYPVSIHAAPATVPPVLTPLNNDTSYCLGDSITLLAQYSPMLYHSNWYTSQGILIGFTDTIYQTTALTSNVFYIMQTDSNGCQSNSNTLILLGDYPASAGPITQHGDTLDYYYGFVFHYQWYLNGVPLPGTDTMTIVATQPGCYTVKGWYLFQDCGSFAWDTVCINSVGISLQNGMQDPFVIFPDPVKEEFTVSGISFPAEMKMYDEFGREVFSKKLFTEKEKINVTATAAGIYFVKIISGDMISTKKIIITD